MLMKRYTRYGEKPAHGILARATEITGEYPLHGHDHYEIEYVTSGVLTHTLNGVTTTLSPGGFYILGLEDMHRMEALTPEVHLLSLCFHVPGIAREFADFLAQHRTPAQGMLPEEDRRCCEMLFSQLLQDQSASSPYAEDIRYAASQLLLLLLYRADPTVHTGSGSVEQAMTAALRYLAERYRERISLEEVARHVGLSPHYFCTVFHRYTGCSFTEYLNIIRARKAQSLLLTELEKNMTDIALGVGFGSYTAFYRAFRRYVGKSPSDFLTENRRG